MAVRQTTRRKSRRRSPAAHTVRPVKGAIELFDVVAIKKPLQGFPAGTEAAVVEIFRVPRLGYCLEVVLDSGKTAGLIDALPREVVLVSKNRPSRSVRKRRE